jgi:oxygen-independent coproporphyrinogen III oxidase
MTGIYLHIPFCKQKCHYCNFFSLASTKNRQAFVDILIKEIDLQKDYLNGETVTTVYFGGGTPSLLEVDALKRIFMTLRETFPVSDDAEITLEANPDDLSAHYLEALKDTAVNRLSIGIQSFDDDDLVYLNRVHSAIQAENCIQLAQEAGFEKITIDLIYGIPTLDDDKWKRNIEQFMQTGIHHLSAYALTVEPKTALHTLIRKGKLLDVDENRMARQFEILLDQMEANGFVHYEISNFARPGHYSRHNSIYWMGGNYLGLGPSAHSFNGVSRQWNVSNLAKYLQLETIEKVVEEKEVLTEAQRYNEYVMTSLRTVWGCDLEHISNQFGKDAKERTMHEAKKHLLSANMVLNENRLLLTNKGKLFADGIASGFFI